MSIVWHCLSCWHVRHCGTSAGVDLALLDAEGRKRSAAVNNTYPGWSGTPGG